MAGHKETPRQKMIGMMYLVLTALLALNVSSAVLDKFTIFNETLEGVVEDTDNANTRQVSAIQQAVADKGNRGDDVKALKKAQQVRAATTELIKEMEALKEQIVQETGGLEKETGTFKGAQDIDKVATIMLAPNEGKGKELEKKLDGYVKQLEELTGQQFATLTPDAKDMPMFANNPDHKTKDFLTLTFEDAPMVAGLASLSQLEAQVLEYEADALGKIAEEVGAKDVSFDKIVPLVRPTSNVVAAGAKFEAELFITAAATGSNPVFKYDGKTVDKIEQAGVTAGKIEFTATPGNYDSKTLMAKKTFKAEIELSDSTYVINHEYFVVKPVVQVRSAALQALYQNCGNELDIQVPALGTAYNPSFSSREAEVRKGNRTGLVTVIPQGRSKVKLAVSSNGNVLSIEEFDVKKVPPPNIQITSRGRPIPADGAEAAALSTITVSAEADENFAREVPNDARYRVTKVTVKLGRSGRAVRTEEFNGSNLDLRQWRSIFRPGDILSINVERVLRRTFTGDNERAKPLQEIYNIPIK